MGQASQLLCSRCSQRYPADQAANLCACGGPLLVQYDLTMVRQSWSRDQLRDGPRSMWRYEPVLPAAARDAVTLQEGWTPLLPAPRLGAAVGARDLWIKDESRNPTDSFKARGLSAAVTMARRFSITKVAIPSAGNAAGALASYAAKAGIEANVFMPSDVPHANALECRAMGANVVLVDGLISDCGRLVAERKAQAGWFDIGTLKEPYRIEGKKTMGYEIAEQFEWQLPDAIVYPCGGGVGLIGIWKAFAELAELGWIGSKRPKMIAVQAAGCAPIVRAYETATETLPWTDARTVAAGLRVPSPLGGPLVLRAVQESSGCATAVSDEAMLDDALLLARSEGLFAAPESGACVSAVRALLRSNFLRPQERILILSTGSGLKYSEAFDTRFPGTNGSEYDKLGGLITPR